MHRPGSSSLILFGIPLISILAFVGAAQAQTGQRVNFGINPTVFRAGQSATAELSVCSVSSPVPLTLSPGNSFLFIVDGSIGTVLGFTTPISVTSASLSPVDFSVSFGASQNQINITYNGAAKLFAYGDCLGLKVTLQASSQVGSGKLSLSSQFVSAVNGNLPFAIVSVLDFANTGMSAVAHDPSLTGDGTGAAPLGVAPGGVTNPDLAAGAVTAAKIAAGQVVKGVTVGASTVTDNVTLAAGPNITITPAGNTLTIAATGGGGGGSSILNQTTLQPGANFNISGNGTAGGTLSADTVSAATQYNIGGSRVLSVTGGSISTVAGTVVNSNTFAGVGAGASVTPTANPASMDGQLNAFFGVNAGINNSTGCCNSFFGNLVGVKNKTGRSNAFFGGAAGIANTTGSFNAFFGDGAGSDFFDPNAERTGDLNTAVGFLSGSGIKAGSSNTFLGSHASAASDVSNATAIGANALVTQSNTLVLGNSASVGIGTSTPASKLTVVGVIESTFGGFKFPDGSVQTSAAVGGGGVPSGSPNYIQSNPSSQQAGVSFNIGGNGTAGGTLSANVVSAATQYNLGGQRIMSVQPAFQSTFLGQNAGVVNNAAFNSFFGSSAGAANTSGLANSFFGDTAGGKNVDGGANSAFGSGAGFSNISGTFNSSFGYHSGINSVGSFNSFFGAQAGASNTVGGSSFFGALAGQNNTTGIQNSFFGYNAGNANATGCCNSFFGFQAGQVSTGDDNSFFGNNAGAANTTGNQNSFFGSGAGFMNNQGSFNSFFGLSAGRANTTGGLNTFVGDSAGLANNGSHNSFFGANAGKNNTTGLFNSFFGRSAGFSSNGDSNVFFGAGAGDSNTTGGSNTFVGTSAGHSNATGGNHTLLGRSADVGVDGLTNATAIGANALVTQSNTLVLGSINGVNGAAADTNVGIGTSAPGSKLTVVGLIESKAGGIKFPDGTVQTSAAAGGSAITQITAGAGLTGGGTTGNVTLSVGAGQGISVAPGAVSIADLGVTTAKLSDAAVTGPKIALGQVVRNINGLTDSVTLAAGANITITPAGNTLTIASTGGGGGGSILNQTALQAAANFNIDGAGKASVFDAATQYNLVGQRVLSIARTEGPDYDNVYVGPGAGALASSDNNSFFGFKAGAGAVVVGGNSFFGSQAGERDTGGALNSFFGYQSGRDNTTGPDNCFFGASAGTQNDVGRENSFFGFSAGFFNQSGGQNSYFGSLAGSNSSGSGNTFVGANAGNNVTPGMVDTGNDNTAVGLNAGNSNISGSNNTALGANAQATSTSSALSNTTAVGAFAQVTRDNALVLGSINGVNGATADTNVGIGTTNPLTRLHVVGDVTLSGNVNISGALVKPAGSFKIDHPLDPENKTLSHSFVESPDMKNIYDGVVKLDSNGEAIVTLPEYFQALNREFRYQLTAIGAPGPNLYVAEEVSNNRFKIAGGKPGSKVSWQVTGVRHDAYADAHRIKVEEDKPALERGYYLHPDLFGQSEEKGVEWARHPEMMQRLKDRREQTQSHGIRP